MAKQRLNAVNFVYTAVGLAVAAGVGYYAWRRLRARRMGTGGDEGAHAGTEGHGTHAEGQGEDSLMDLRRQTRKAGRAIHDTGSQVGKAVRRGASDVGESFEDANSSGKELLADAAGGATGTTGSGGAGGKSGATGNSGSKGRY